MSLNYTPGPWFVNPTSDVGDWIVGNQSSFIADCTGENISEEESKANARLIATAPDLLEELRSIMEACNADDPDSYRSDSPENALDYVFALAKETIERIESE